MIKLKLKLKENKINLQEKMLKSFTESLLLELLNKTDKIQHWEDYIDDYDTNKNRNFYKDDPRLKEVKKDLYEMLLTLEQELYDIPKVRSVKFKESDHTGLSNYIEIKFTKPLDSKYCSHYGNEYILNIRLSDHIPKQGYSPSVTNNIDIVGQTFNDLKRIVMGIVKTQSNKLSQFETRWKKSKKPSSNRKNFNKGKKKNKKESFTRDILRAKLEPGVVQYLDSVDVDMDEIPTELGHMVDFGELTYRQIIDIITDCLNRNVIEYTFEDFMNWELLADDVQEVIQKRYHRQPLMI